MKKFDRQRDIIVNNGVDRITLGTEKTGEPVTIKVQPIVKEMIARLDRPLPSNKHTNALLKIIGEAAGFTKPLNYHKSRHSFAVNSRTFGIPTDAIQKLLGHRDIRTTMIYSKIVDTQLDEYMDKWDDTLKK